MFTNRHSNRLRIGKVSDALVGVGRQPESRYLAYIYQVTFSDELDVVPRSVFSDWLSWLDTDDNVFVNTAYQSGTYARTIHSCASMHDKVEEYLDVNAAHIPEAIGGS
jgi:hypothetical protein